MKISTVALLAGAFGVFALTGQQAQAASHAQKRTQAPGATGQGMMSPGLVTPRMDAARGRMLFASKGCVVCHAVNGVGGQDAPPLDASTMPTPMNPFEFAAKMWRGAEAMVALQREELGEPIQLNGDELADIIAFVHHAGEQKKFSQADIPPRVKELMEHTKEKEPHEEKEKPESGKMKMKR